MEASTCRKDTSTKTWRLHKSVPFSWTWGVYLRNQIARHNSFLDFGTTWNGKNNFNSIIAQNQNALLYFDCDQFGC
jgi:hypothetical protein